MLRFFNLALCGSQSGFVSLIPDHFIALPKSPLIFWIEEYELSEKKFSRWVMRIMIDYLPLRKEKKHNVMTNLNL